MKNTQILFLILLSIGCQNKLKIETIKGRFLLNSAIFESFYEVKHEDHEALKDSLIRELHSNFTEEVIAEEIQIFNTLEKLELLFKPCKVFYTSDEDELKRIYFKERDFEEFENIYWKQEKEILEKHMIYELKVIEIAPNIFNFESLEKIEIKDIPVGEIEIEPLIIKSDTISGK